MLLVAFHDELILLLSRPLWGQTRQNGTVAVLFQSRDHTQCFLALFMKGKKLKLTNKKILWCFVNIGLGPKCNISNTVILSFHL